MATVRSRSKRPDPKILADIVRRIVVAAKPERIVMFGSAARGEMGPDSDLDFLVIKRGKFKRRKLEEAIYSGLCGAGAAVDALIVTPEEIELYRDVPSMVICPALKEGLTVYGPKTSPAKRSTRVAQSRS